MNGNMPSPEDVQRAALKVQEAQRNYEARMEELSRARRNETAALNIVNEAEKEFDALVKAFKKVPGDSSWSARNQLRVGAEAHDQ